MWKVSENQVEAQWRTNQVRGVAHLLKTNGRTSQMKGRRGFSNKEGLRDAPVGQYWMFILTNGANSQFVSSVFLPVAPFMLLTHYFLPHTWLQRHAINNVQNLWAVYKGVIQVGLRLGISGSQCMEPFLYFSASNKWFGSGSLIHPVHISLLQKLHTSQERDINAVCHVFFG